MAILAPGTPAFDRGAFIDWYRRNRERSAAIFALVDESAHYERPIALRHPFVFYEGHLPAFSFNTLNARALGEPPVDPAFQKLFERGIDPDSVDAAQGAQRRDWPSREAVAAFGRLCDQRVEHALANARLDDPGVPALVGAQAAYTILEHEPLHHETLFYIIHQLEHSRKTHVPQRHHDHGVPRNELRAIQAGHATLGTDRGALPFGWDNEFARHAVDVPAFGIQTYPITNGEWLTYLADGGEKPWFWVERDGEWHLRTVFEELPLPHSWPVYVTQRQAAAYAVWAGMRLPTEAEYHRAAFGTPNGDERPLPWGNDPPGKLHGNFDFVRFDPEPVDEHPAGASAWGVHDLIGNGWEWTATPFGPFPEFEPMASYPNYSADFFDGAHYVMKGASPVTARELVRRSFRNWFRDDYPYMYAKFRCVTT